MLNEDQNKKVGLFFQALENIKNPTTGKVDIGLIVMAENYDEQDIYECYPQEDAVEVMINQNMTFGEVAEPIADALESGKWILAVLKTPELPEGLYEMLRNLSSIGQAELLDFRGKENYVLKPDEKGRLVVITTDAILEKIEPNTFLNIFGPIVRL